MFSFIIIDFAAGFNVFSILCVPFGATPSAVFPGKTDQFSIIGLIKNQAAVLPKV
jgi:hypothetical protein